MKLFYKYLIIVAVNLACYYRSIDGDFVFDDSVAILKNRDVVDGNFDRQTFQKIFVENDFWGNNLTKKDSHKSYRPLTTLTFLVERRVNGGLDSRSMKLVNLCIHVVNCCLLLNFLQAILNDKKLAFISTVLFTAHPIHTEAVCGIVSRSDLMACLVFLLCGNFYFYVFDKDRTDKHFSHSLPFLILVGLMSFIGILFKENAVTIMPTLAALDMARTSKSFLTNSSLILRTLFMSIATIGIVCFRLWMQNFTTPVFRVEDNPIAAADDRLTRILSQNYLFSFNFHLLLVPDRLCFDWSFNSIKKIKNVNDLRILYIILLYSMLIALAVKGIRSRNILASLILLIVPFSPAIGVIKVGFVIAERILYIPSIGFAILIGIGIKSIQKHFKSTRRPLIALVCILIILHSLKTHQRSLDWQSESQLFFSALKVVPANAKVYYNIARISSESKNIRMIRMSLRFYQTAIRLHPNYESAHMNLGNLYRELNQFQKAKFHLEKAVEILEEFPTAWMNLGIVQAVLKDYKSAESSYMKALSYRNGYANCYYNMGNLYIEMSNATAAVDCWKRAIGINPAHRKAWSNILAFFDNQRDNHETVLKYSSIALTYLPNDANILFSRANTFGKMNRFEEAEAIFRQIIDAEPTKSIFYANLGVLYHRWGKKELAVKYYQAALALDETLTSAQNNLIKLQGG